MRSGWFAGKTEHMARKHWSWRAFRRAALHNLSSFALFAAEAWPFPDGWSNPFARDKNASRVHTGANYSLSGMLRRTCGDGCGQLIVLHQEQLSCEMSLLGSALGIPMQRLGHMRVGDAYNIATATTSAVTATASGESVSSSGRAPGPEPGPAWPSTRATCELITETESTLFTDFGYRRRDCTQLP